MISARLYVLIFLFIAISTVAFGQAANAKLAARSGVISGRITMHGKGLPGIIVTLRSGGFGGQNPTQTAPQAKTDADGKYRIADVPMGSWFVTPVAPVYTVPGASRITTTNDAVVITGGDTVDGIDFSLVRGGVITGKVTDTDGRPVIEQGISIQNMDAATQQGGRPNGPSGNFRTDDRGIYRIYGVPAGHYAVSVGSSQRFSAYSTIQGQVAYKQTFHPDVTDAAQATVIEVVEGAEVSTVDITVGRTVDEYSVTGRVIDRDSGVPLPNVGFSLSILAGGGDRQRAMGLMDLPVVSDSNGQFRVDNVVPGKYMISVAPQNSDGMSGQSAAFDVINQDVKDVEVRAVRGASLSGVVALDGNFDQSIQSELMQFQVQVFVQGNGGAASAAASAQTVPLNADGSFQVTGLPAGSVRLSIAALDASLQGAFKVLRIERDNVPQQGGIAVNSGDQVTGVKIVAAYADGIVQGVVTFQNGTLPAGSRVFAALTPTGQTRGFVGGSNVDSRGHFLIQNVPAGTYTLLVNVMPQGGRRGGGQQQPVTAQQNVIVTEGQISNASIVVDLGQNTPPAAP
ncbi:MAG: hypothetical protein QOH96_2838 [Blastocatellia bacterium]|nr:hypothetical protein [Blastocatellia bacterium]